MKSLKYLAVPLFGSFAYAQSPQETSSSEFVGMTLQEVKAELGEPRATLKHDAITVARFDTAKIRFEEGVAVEQVAIDPDKRESQAEMMQRVAEEKRQVGQRLHERYQASGEVEQLPPEKQLEFWLAFQRKYPEVDLSGTISDTRDRAQTQRLRQQQARQEEEIAYLKDRLSQVYRRGYYDGPDYYSPYGFGYFPHRYRDDHRHDKWREDDKWDHDDKWDRGDKWRDGHDRWRRDHWSVADRLLDRDQERWGDRVGRHGDRSRGQGTLRTVPSAHSTPAGRTPAPVAPMISKP